MTILRFALSDLDAEQHLQQLQQRQSLQQQDLQQSVSAIIDDVRKRGDAALLEYTTRWDRFSVADASQLELSKTDCQQAYQQLSAAQRQALDTAAKRVTDYHQHQVAHDWSFVDDLGNRLGQRVTPLDRVGLYVPGGKAAYPSSVLMNALPAKVAGVTELIMVVPTPEGQINPLVKAAAWVAGVDRVFTIGGAQAVAALAYGTATIPRVDKIVGPGNAYVATAKRLVFGQVGIDMIAGPSEILIVADDTANADWLAYDLFAQAEHDEMAQSILVSSSAALLQRVADAITRLLPSQPRQQIIRAALERNGALIEVANDAQAIALVNRFAPEHLQLSVANPEKLLPDIRHAGAIFMGHHTPEALGDYCLGPSHVLPTAGSARFSSPLGVYDFQKRSSIMTCSVQGAQTLAPIAGILADSEQLAAHAASARARLQSL
jgi:histidinol dehydrogenase